MMNLREKYSTIEIATGTCLITLFRADISKIESFFNPEQVLPGPGWDQNNQRENGLLDTFDPV